MKAINAKPLELATIPGTRTAILIPANYTIDMVAAGLSLMMALKKVNQSVFLLSPTAAKVGDSNLFDIDQLSSSIPSENFVITLKNAVPKLKRVKHFVDGEDLKFMLFPRENVEKFDPSEISYGLESANFDLIISVGADSKSALSSFPSLSGSTCPVLVISKNPTHGVNADHFIVDSEAKSLCEIIARLIESTKLPVWEDLAYNIFQGLYSATNNFSVGNLTQGVLEAATWAVANGANHTALSADRPEPTQKQVFSQPENIAQSSQEPQTQQSQRPRDRDRDRGRSRDYGRQQGNSFDNRRNQNNPQPRQNHPTPIGRSDENRQAPASDWESKPKIYQGSTIVEPDANK